MLANVKVELTCDDHHEGLIRTPLCALDPTFDGTYDFELGPGVRFTKKKPQRS